MFEYGHRWILTGVMVLLAGAGVAVSQEELDDPPPAGAQQLLPRGRIAAVFEPQFVSAAEAEITEDAWVLGVVIEGQPKAYSLNLLNHHEVVNDQSGDTAFAAVW